MEQRAATFSGVFSGTRLAFLDEGSVMWMARGLGLVTDTSETEISVNAGFLGVTRKGRGGRRAFSPGDPRDLELLVGALRDDGQLSGLRPSSYDDEKLVWETAEGTPVRFPLRSSQAMRLWMLGPSESDGSPDSPVLLLEEDSGASASGATMFLYEIGAQTFGEWAGADDFDARATTSQQMLDWLRAVGAEFERSRRVVTLYHVVRHVALPPRDQQVSTFLAYPLFIAELP